jgi:hypothetical protein
VTLTHSCLGQPWQVSLPPILPDTDPVPAGANNPGRELFNLTHDIQLSLPSQFCALTKQHC